MENKRKKYANGKLVKKVAFVILWVKERLRVTDIQQGEREESVENDYCWFSCVILFSSRSRSSKSNSHFSAFSRNYLKWKYYFIPADDFLTFSFFFFFVKQVPLGTCAIISSASVLEEKKKKEKMYVFCCILIFIFVGVSNHFISW